MTPTRQNYSFAGWATSGNGEVSYSAGGKYTSNSAITLYAIWSGNPYTISLNNQSATSAGTTAIYGIYGKGIYSDASKTILMTPSANGITIPTKKNVVTYNYNGSGASNTSATANCGFGGYYTGTNGSGTQMIANTGKITNSLTNVAFSGNTTLYAKWTLGSVTLPNATRTNYIFNGWYTAASGGSKVGNAGASYTPSASTTLYAQWKGDPYFRVPPGVMISEYTSGLGYPPSGGKNYSYTVFLKGFEYNGTLSYQWYRNNSVGGSFYAIANSNSVSYSFLVKAGDPSFEIYCVVTCTVGGESIKVKLPTQKCS